MNVDTSCGEGGGVVLCQLVITEVLDHKKCTIDHNHMFIFQVHRTISPFCGKFQMNESVSNRSCSHETRS